MSTDCKELMGMRVIESPMLEPGTALMIAPGALNFLKERRMETLRDLTARDKSAWFPDGGHAYDFSLCPANEVPRLQLDNSLYDLLGGDFMRETNDRLLVRFGSRKRPQDFKARLGFRSPLLDPKYFAIMGSMS